MFKERLSYQIDNKAHEVARMEGEMKKLKEEVNRAEQINNNMRAKTMDLELEKESLQVRVLVWHFSSPNPFLFDRICLN